MPAAFDYPENAHVCRHGPRGYPDYQSYRPWLRDEFAFRCVYCLVREQWGRVSGEFDVEHFTPQAKSPALGLVYENLLNACHSCNLLKGGRDLPDPRLVLLRGTVLINPDGSVEGRTDDAKRLIKILGLDSNAYNTWRLIWIRNIELAEQYDREQYQRLMGFPDDLPDLSRLRPPSGNSRTEGINDSYYEKRRRGELPETY